MFRFFHASQEQALTISHPFLELFSYAQFTLQALPEFAFQLFQKPGDSESYHPKS